MGFFKKVRKKISKAVSGASKTVGKVGKKVTDLPGLKQVKQAGRLSVAGTLGLTTLGLAPKGGKMFGISSDLGKKFYRGGGNVGKVAAAVAGGAALAPAFAGMGGSGLLTGMGGKLAGMVGKTGLSQLASKFLGGGGQGGPGGLEQLAGLYGGYQGFKGSEKAMDDVSRYELGAGRLIKQQEELAGLDPIVAAQMKRQAQQDLRASQAERGIYESGVSAAQEAELMPRIEQSQRAWQLQQLAGITPQYTPLMQSGLTRAGMFGSGEEMGGALAGFGGEGEGGGFDLASLAGKAWDVGSDWLGGLFNKDQGYDLGESSLAGMRFGGEWY